MKPYLIKPLDIKMNEPLDVDVSGGSRPRIVVRNKQNYHQYFFKTYLHNSREIWAEMFASKLEMK